jgi:hypothetical protein
MMRKQVVECAGECAQGAERRAQNAECRDEDGMKLKVKGDVGTMRKREREEEVASEEKRATTNDLCLMEGASRHP